MVPDTGPNCGAKPTAGSGSDGASDLVIGEIIGGVNNAIGRVLCVLTGGDMVGAAATMKSSITRAYLSAILRDNRSKPRGPTC